jgi:hypothetical protein
MLKAEAAPSLSARYAAIAQRLGMLVESDESVALSGKTYRSLDIVCRDNTEALAYLNELAIDDSQYGVGVRELARRLWTWAQRSSRLAGLANDATAEVFARKVHALVRDHVEYVDDPQQVFRSSDVTLQIGVGNCVNTARLVCALARVCGLESRAMPIRPHGVISHTAAVIRHGGTWHWAEATIAAEYGEEPIAAARRLGIMRPDVGVVAGLRKKKCCAKCADDAHGAHA